jgi:hypothetical protein
MTMAERGHYLSLSLPRRLVNDMLHFAHRVPTIPVERFIDVRRVRDLRRRVPQRLGWCALFVRAYGLVASRFPELRRAYLGFPKPRLYEHPCNIATLTFERRYRGEYEVFFGKIRAPENQQLIALQEHIRRYKEAPVEKVSLYRRALLVSRFPRPIRRLLWRYALHLSGPYRATHLGTFGLSTYSGLGAHSLHPLSPLTTTLNYGPVREDGTVAVRIIYDHRAMDGGTVARALAALEEVFNDELLQEMSRLRAGMGENPPHDGLTGLFSGSTRKESA